MAGRRLTALSAALLCASIALSLTAEAQQKVPLPVPAPRPKVGAVPPPAPQAAASVQQAASDEAPRPPGSIPNIAEPEASRAPAPAEAKPFPPPPTAQPPIQAARPAPAAESKPVPLPPAPAARPAPAAEAKPAPAPRPAAAEAKPAAPPATVQLARPVVPESKPVPVIPSRPGAAARGATAFDPEQRALADKVSAYLSGIRTLVGNFVQIGPDGRRTEGDFYIQKPGKVRFEYEPPTPIDIIADGQSVVVRDRNLATQDLYPLSQTPLRFLLSDRIDLLRDTNLVGVFADDTFATVVIEERQVMIGTNRLMLMFDAKNLKLKQWTVTDPQGFDTTVAVYNLDATKKPDPGLFKINYERMIQ